MPATSAHTEHGRRDTEPPAAADVSAIVTSAAVLAAAWIAAGSMGLLAGPLRCGLTWVALAVAIAAGWPTRGCAARRWLALTGAVVLALIMTAARAPAAGVLAVAVVAAALALAQGGLRGRVVLVAAIAATVLGTYRLACDSVPTAWHAANAVGWALGRAAGWISGRPLSVGACFGGVDFLVSMAAVYAGWLVFTPARRLPRAAYAAAAILAGHLVYLVVLAQSNTLLAGLPEPVQPQPSDAGHLLGNWTLSDALRSGLPWNLPVLAGLIHATIAAAMVRWAAWLPPAETSPASPPPARRTAEQGPEGLALLADVTRQLGPLVLAATIPVLSLLAFHQSTLKGKTIVAFDGGTLDWGKPEHDRDSTGAYGMLPVFVESLGGRFVRPVELSEADLADPQDKVLLLSPPDRPWAEGTVELVESFVRSGGSLLLLAGPATDSLHAEDRLNELLEPTAIRMRRDTAVAAAPHWEHCCRAPAHPATVGVDQRRNRFGLAAGPSIRTGWPARPVLAARFAFSDPGSDAARHGAAQYDPGEQLGDLVLAAEQRLGKGTVVVLGHASSLHNDAIADSYQFVGRLLGYLAGKSVGPQDWPRQVPAVLAMAGLIGLLAWRATAARTGLATAVLGISTICCTAAGHFNTRVLPEGRAGSRPNNLAYIDASHLEAYSSDTFSGFGVGGLARTLMRNGYLPLKLPELSRERLERAGLLISVAPARPFSQSQRETVRDFVAGGGTLICIAGAEHVAPSRKLLADFDFCVPPSPVPPGSVDTEPEPLGMVRTLYINRPELRAAVQSYASWEVECTADNPYKMAQWSNGVINRPFVVSRQVGAGYVAVVGDTRLACNRNLESQAIEMPENKVFWRWFLTRITPQHQWTPPVEEGPEEENIEEEESTEEKSTEQESTELESTEQESTEQESTELESTEQESTELESTELESTEQTGGDSPLEELLLEGPAVAPDDADRTSPDSADGEETP